MVQNQITVSLCLTIATWLSGSAYQIVIFEAVRSAILATAWLLVSILEVQQHFHCCVSFLGGKKCLCDKWLIDWLFICLFDCFVFYLFSICPINNTWFTEVECCSVQFGRQATRFTQQSLDSHTPFRATQQWLPMWGGFSSPLRPGSGMSTTPEMPGRILYRDFLSTHLSMAWT